MTRSIFDPTGGETIRGGDRYTGQDAGNKSHMPPRVVDGEVKEDEQASAAAIDAAHANVNEVALTDEEAAERLQQMQARGEAKAKEESPAPPAQSNPVEKAE